MKKTILAISLFIPSAALACFEPAPVCELNCIEHEITIHEQGETMEQAYALHTNTFVDFSEIPEHPRKDKKDEPAKRKNHCLDPVVYDGIIGGLDGQTSGGYRLDQDGSTLWDAKGEYHQRCLPAETKPKAPKQDGGHYAALVGYKLITESWFETLTITKHWEKIYTEYEKICSIKQGDPNHSPVPEPSTIALFGIGVAGIGFMGRKWNK